MQVLELEGLEFKVFDGGITWQCKGSVYALTWAAAKRLSDWLSVEFGKRNEWAPRGSVIERLSPEALTAAVWNGEGWPPVGCVCEISVDGGTPGKGLITYTAGNLVCWKWRGQKDKDECCAYTHRLRFYPVRTAEQLAAEAREKAIQAIAEVICKDGAFDLEDPEVKASAKALYDAGYGRAGV